jgi:hypothetical protein
VIPLSAGQLDETHLHCYVRIPVAGRPPLTGLLTAAQVLPDSPVLVELDERSWHNPALTMSRHLLAPTDTVEVYP